MRIFGCSSFWERASGRPGRKVVRCNRAGVLPVRRAARDAEQIGWAQ
jgi:hypothetical protein